MTPSKESLYPCFQPGAEEDQRTILAKKTAKNQVTLPKAIVEQLPEVQYFDVSLRGDEIVLRPASVTSPGERLKAVRAKIKALGLAEKDIDDAIAWARRRRR